MDLYIQVGVLLLFLAALSLFIYIYTAPAQQFTQKINETNQEINDRLVTVENMDVAPFHNNISSPGTTIYPLIRDSRANKLAVLVQTKNSQGLIVNYGYQVRGANYADTQMKPYGFSGVGTGGTDFERNYVTSVEAVFGQEGVATTTAAAINKFGDQSFFNITGTTTKDLASDLVAKLRQQSNLGSMTVTYDAHPPSSATAQPEFQKASTPKIAFSDPTITNAIAVDKGRTFSSTGFLYTDNVLKMDAPVNDNFSYADNQGSLYKFNQNSTYYSAIILNANNDPIGIYIEEHGVNPKGAVLAAMMLNNGTITSIY